MTAMEFLNLLCYTIDKAEHDKAELERWRRTH